MGHEFAGFIDDTHEGDDVLGTFASVQQKCSIRLRLRQRGWLFDLTARRGVTARILDAGYTMPVLVHPRAYVSTTSSTGPGTFVMAGALVDCRVTLADNVVVWLGVCVSHDCNIGPNTFLSPNCTVCGDCRVGGDCFVGAGAVIVSHAVVLRLDAHQGAERYVTRR